MILNEHEKEICNKFSKRDESDHVHCFECPLRRGVAKYDFRCVANSHYDEKENDWVYDSEIVEAIFSRRKTNAE